MNILIVDDDSTNIMVLSSMLKKDNYSVVTATNGRDALNKFMASDIDLVLMDVMMPDMDGYEATREIKNISQDRFVPVIFLTAITDEVALAKCVESGGDDFLTKPYNRIILRAKIEAMTRIQSLYNTINNQKSQLALLNHKIDEDIQLAKHVYESIINSPDYHSIFKRWMSPVSEFNGDIVMSSKSLNSGYHFMLGDFTGHGMAASFGTIPVSDLFYGMSKLGYSISDIFVEINNKLLTLLPTGYFCAACFISVSSDGKNVSILNAGLPDVIIQGQDTILRIKSQSVPLGISAASYNDFNFEEYTITDPSRIYIYSDGVIESTNASGCMLGIDGLIDIINTDVSIGLDKIASRLNEYRGSIAQEDDITISCIDLPLKQNLDQNALQSNKQSYSWELYFSFDENSLRVYHPVMNITNAILSQDIPDAFKDKIFTILTELFNNSLEHGILGLDSSLKSSADGFSEYYSRREDLLSSLTKAQISINIKHTPSQNGGLFIFTLKDSGTGFDTNKLESELTANNSFSGRGIMLVKSLCKSVRYLDNGTEVIAELEWNHD